MKLFFDTETTGMIDFKADRNAPRIVQLAALLTDDGGEEVASVSVIIKPDGWKVSDEAAAIHGITTERASFCGVPESAALHLFDSLLLCADTACAHNFSFDHAMMSRGSEIRFNVLLQRKFCTMMAMTPVCQLPGKYSGQYKWPKLQEAFKHAFGKEFEGAHDAMADVRACAAVYFWLQKQHPCKP